MTLQEAMDNLTPAMICEMAVELGLVDVDKFAERMIEDYPDEVQDMIEDKRGWIIIRNKRDFLPEYEVDYDE